MRVELPINREPFIKSYAHHAFYFAIVQNSNITNDYDAIFSNAKYSFSSVNQEDPILINRNCNVTIEKDINLLKFNLEKIDQGNNDYATLYNFHAMGNGDAIIKVEVMKNINPWSMVELKISSKYSTNLVSAFINGERFAFTCSIKDKIVDMKRRSKASNLGWLKITKNDSVINTFFSEDGDKWVKLDEYSIDLGYEFFVGIGVTQNEYFFLNWFFCNYIQIEFDKSKKGDLGKLDFYSGLNINKEFPYFINPFVVVNTIDLSIINNNVNFIMKSIDQGYYILFNEKYLLYGYDEEKECILVMNFDEEETFITKDWKYNKFKSSYKVQLIKPTLPWTGFKFNILIVKDFLNDYINSINSKNDLAYCLDNGERVYGLNVYDELYTEFYSNVPSFMILLEHKRCMVSRIEFLYKNQYLNENNLHSLKKKFVELINRMTIFINQYKNYRMTNENELKKELMLIKHADRKVMVELLDCLNETN
ncbi:MAG: hypothetical protein K0R00_246 [Herbinix sp.]|jgi:hypothetical protein|nr:hypothetical protein [Herbinix sp.]